jgi:hypothetical protein
MVDQRDRIYGILSDVMHAMHSQTQFAEAKNAALLTVNFAIVVGIATLFASDVPLASQLQLSLIMCAITLGGAGLLSLASFLPVMSSKAEANRPGSDQNLFFWASIARMSPTSYAQQMLEALGSQAPAERLELDLANQVVVNARVARRKFRVFYVAAIVTFWGFVAPIGLLAWFFFAQGMELR